MALPVNRATPGIAHADPTVLKQAGQDFEALLLEKLLQSSRSAQSGPAADWRAMADRQLAKDLARASPLGVARLLEPAQHGVEVRP